MPGQSLDKIFGDARSEWKDRRGRAYKGKIASNAASAADEVEVIVPDFSGRHRHGPCRFPMVNGETLPSRGDHCLVAFDEDEDPWILVWYVEA